MSPLFATPWTEALWASLSFTVSWRLLRLVCIDSVMPSNHLILCHPLLILPSISPSIGIFSNESVLCIRQPKYWNFSFSISLSSECSGLISFRMTGLILQKIKLRSSENSQESSLAPQFKSIIILYIIGLAIYQSGNAGILPAAKATCATTGRFNVLSSSLAA